MKSLIPSILCGALFACDSSPPDQSPAPVPFQRAQDSTSLQQYIGTWQSNCILEVIYNYPPSPTTPDVYKIIRYTISDDKAERNIQRYSDDQCTEYTDSTRGYSYYEQTVVLTQTSISYDLIDTESGLLFGLLEGPVSAIYENNLPVTHYTVHDSMELPVYRGEQTLFMGEYYYYSGGGFYRLDTDTDLYFLGEPDFLLVDN